MPTPNESHDLSAHSSRAPLGREALERVLARAAELQSADGDSLELLTEQQLMELGQEVGLSSVHIRQAIAEERTRVDLPEKRRWMGDMFGPTHIEARRMVNGAAPTLLHRLDRWMDKEEALQVKRRLQDRITWEARRDFLGSIKRGFNVGGRGYALSTAHEVGGTVTQVDEKRALVAVAADFSTSRRRAVSGAATTGALLGGTAVLLVAIAAATGGSLLVAGAIAAALTGMGGGATVLFARGNRDTITRGKLALEQALDRLEQHVEPPQLQAPTSVIGTLIDAAVRELK